MTLSEDSYPFEESMLPLTLGAALAVFVLLTTIPGMTWLAAKSHESRIEEEAQTVETKPKEPYNVERPRLGAFDLSTPTVALISHSDFRELQATQRITHQPALQSVVDPTPEADVAPNPTPPAENAQQTQPAAPPSLVSPEPNPQPLPPQPIFPTGLPEQDVQAPDERVAAKDFGKPTLPLPHQVQPVRIPTLETTPPQPETQPSKATPTSATKSETESPPTHYKIDSAKAIPGRTLTGPGVEIVTRIPRLSVPARYLLATSVTVNPKAKIVFNHEGKVIEVEWVRKTDLDNIDGPIFSSIYRWQAKGPKIDALVEGQTFTINSMQILLVSNE